VTYWVDHFPGQGVFPSGIPSKSCSGYEVGGVRLLRKGLYDIQRLILSHLWVPLLRVCFPSSAMQYFFKPICH
jgi:hypothetical protein